MKARVRTAPVNHMPMLTAPSAVVDIVLEAAREAIEDRSVEVPALLGDRGQHRAPSVPDLIIAATAELAGLTVLHVDEVKRTGRQPSRSPTCLARATAWLRVGRPACGRSTWPGF